MASKRKTPSLAEKISSLVTAAPTVFGSDDENEESKARVVEQYDESESDQDPAESTFRKRNVHLLDQVDNRYKGKKVSRKDVYETKEEDESDEDTAGVEESSNSDDDDSVHEDSEEDDIGSESQDDSNADEHSEIDEDNPLRRDRAKEPTIKTVSSSDVRADVERGNCVREQLKIWETLLEARIKLQKCLVTSNKMPQHDTYEKFAESERFKKDTDEGKIQLRVLLENLLRMQRDLLKNYPETRNIAKKGGKRKAEETIEEDDDDEEICSDTEDETKAEETDSERSSVEEEASPRKRRKKQSLEEYENILAENHENYREYRNSVIKKWNDKTRVASGNLNKNSSQAVVKQIEFVLGDKAKLVKRTQLKRSEYAILGKEEGEAASSLNDDGRRTQEYDREIYDDDDFYHQLLRELIEYKSSDLTDPVQLSKQWIALQNMRSKMKRKIDTRATKGRRIRYNVHPKLVNFMAPVVIHDTWSDLAKNELYNSVFGQIKSREIDAKSLRAPSDE